MAGIETGTSRQSHSNTRISPMHSPQVQSSFINTCLKYGVREKFCRELTSPIDRQKEKNKFYRTYPGQPHILMPHQSSWNKGIYLLQIAESLSEYGEICAIRNWYRPEPYNSRVEGSSNSEHLSAGAIDIEFCSPAEKKKALRAALAMRQKYKKPASVGVYGEGNTVIHIGFSNRIYGPNIAYHDRAAATQAAWNSVSEPGKNLKNRNQMSQNRPRVQRASGSNFWRNIVNFFRGT